MKRFGSEIIITLLGIFLAWYGLSNINWKDLLDLENHKDQTAEKLGDHLWNRVEQTETIIYDERVTNRLDTLIGHICSKNGLNCNNVKLHVVKNDQVNAFALPGDHLVVFSGLINYCENEAELCGVLGHEMAHIKKNHVMKKLVKELGLSLLVTATSGSTGGNVIGKIFRVISSSAYDRDLEREADQIAVKYLSSAKIDPQQFADLLYRFGDGTSGGLKAWLSTHPNAKQRAKSIVDFLGEDDIEDQKILNHSEWQALKEVLKDN